MKDTQRNFPCVSLFQIECEFFLVQLLCDIKIILFCLHSMCGTLSPDSVVGPVILSHPIEDPHHMNHSNQVHHEIADQKIEVTWLSIVLAVICTFLALVSPFKNA